MVFRVMGQRLVCSGQFQQRIEAHVLTFTQQTFAQTQGMARVAGDTLRQGLRFGLKGFMGANLLYQPPLECLGGDDGVTGESHQAGLGDADDARQQPGAAIAGNYAQAHEAFGEQRRTGRQADVAHTGQVQAGADRRTVDRCDHRDVQLIQRQRDTLDAVAVGIAQLIGRTGEDALATTHVLDVATGAKSAAVAGQHHDPCRAITTQLSAKVDELLDLLRRGQRIPSFRMVHADRDVSLAAIQAYNDWHLHDWCNAAPGRFIPLMLVPWWDMQAAAAEVERLAKQGVHAVSLSDNPAMHGFPSIHSDYWDPLWKACADNNVVICCHIGTGVKANHASDLSPIDAWITSMPISIANSAADWICAPMWKKFPNLRMALSEGSIGWIPYLLERADFTHRHHNAWTNSNFGGKLPSDIFHKHFITCFIEDNFGLQNLKFMNEDMVTWESDYPHSDCTWPHSPESAWVGLQHLPKETIDKVTHLNTPRNLGASS